MRTITHYMTANRYPDEAIKTLGLKHLSEKHQIDAVKISAAWLQAQRQTKNVRYTYLPIKHLIENWGGLYIPREAVEAAAKLIRLKGNYPNYAISSQFVLPSRERLALIDLAGSQPNYHSDGKSFFYRHTELILADTDYFIDRTVTRFNPCKFSFP